MGVGPGHFFLGGLGGRGREEGGEGEKESVNALSFSLSLSSNFLWMKMNVHIPTLVRKWYFCVCACITRPKKKGKEPWAAVLESEDESQAI